MIEPEYKPCKGVRTPLACATADLVKAPVAGMACTKDPNMLQRPRDIISWVASTTSPAAAKCKKYCLQGTFL